MLRSRHGVQEDKLPNPELIALLTCDAAAVDPNGKATLYGLFDIIWAEQFPARHLQFSLFCKCRFSTPGEARVVIEDPHGAVAVTSDPIKAQSAGNAQAIYAFAGFEFPSAGTYTIRLVGAEGTVGTTSLEVRTRQ